MTWEWTGKALLESDEGAVDFLLDEQLDQRPKDLQDRTEQGVPLLSLGVLY